MPKLITQQPAGREGLLFFGKVTVVTLIAVACIEFLSFAVFVYPAVGTVAFAVIALATFALALWRLEYGVYIAFAELLVGSKGYLFAIDIAGTAVSVRHAIFSAVMLAFCMHAIRMRQVCFFQLPVWEAILLFTCCIAFGTVSGVLHGNDLYTVFLDMNGYLFLGLILPAAQSIVSKDQLKRLLQVAAGAMIALSVTTLLLLFTFAHSITAFNGTVYRWIRVTGVGEITPTHEQFYRIFFQSHIFHLLFFFVAFAFCVATWQERRTKQVFVYGAFSALLLTIIITSWSRSFWLALVVSMVAMAIAFVSTKLWRWKDIGHAAVLTVATGAASLIVLFLLTNVPLLGEQWKGFFFAEIVCERASYTAEEPAISTRMNILAPLWDVVNEHLYTGSGFGATLTYTTDDPRAIDMMGTDQYTTFAFEWGYLDLLYELGVLGLLAYLVLFVVLFWHGARVVRSAQTTGRKVLALSFMTGLLCLLFVHVTTPYLSHPLGIGFIILFIIFVLERPRD
ncbi:MAG: O-antigen ligase family protein [Candidatus Kerfeldbacteria bacterium]